MQAGSCGSPDCVSPAVASAPLPSVFFTVRGDALLHAVDVGTGGELWTAHVGVPPQSGGTGWPTPPTARGGVLFAAGVGAYPGVGANRTWSVSAVNASSGAVAWRTDRESGGEGVGSLGLPVVQGAGELILIATGQPLWGKTGTITLNAFHASTGAPLWEFRTDPDFVMGGFETAVHGGAVYVVAGAKALVAVDAADGSVLWRFPVDDGFAFSEGPVVADSGRAVVLTAQNLYTDPSSCGEVARWSYLYVIDAATGALRANTSLGGLPRAPPVALDGAAFAVAFKDDCGNGSCGGCGGVAAYDAGTGSEVWRFEADGEVKWRFEADGALYTISWTQTSQYLYRLNVTTGALEWRSSLKSGTTAATVMSSAVAMDTVYVITTQWVDWDYELWVLALGAGTGGLLWRTTLPYDDSGASFNIPAPAVAGGAVVAVVGSDVVGLSAVPAW